MEVMQSPGVQRLPYLVAEGLVPFIEDFEEGEAGGERMGRGLVRSHSLEWLHTYSRIDFLYDALRPIPSKCLGGGSEASWMFVGISWEASRGFLGVSFEASWGPFRDVLVFFFGLF